MSNQPVKVFYDGLCVVCSSEINHYKKMQGGDKIDFVDITSLDFNASVENLNPHSVHKELHAKDKDGKVYIGVDAFVLIWSQIDKLNWLSKMAQTWPIKKVLQLNYKLFVKVRPYLPRKSCEASPYCETKSKV
jgi:predicted DCC family thiol-disulfide oxidoreductase YuxK